MDFSVIEGQELIKESLRKAVENNQVGHAYIFSGPKGIGKRTTARIFAGLLLCLSGYTGKACGKCQPCRMLKAGTSPDFYVLSTDASSISVNDIRNMQNNVAVRPMYSPRKVYLIEEAEKMTVQAQNCLLKTLEEPTSYSVIILAVSNYHSLLETIRSRAARLEFRRNSPDEVKRAIYRQYKRYSEHTDFIASYSGGIIGIALMLEKSKEFAELRKKAMEMLSSLSSGKTSHVNKAYNLFKNDKTSTDTILDILISFYRDMYMVCTTGKDSILINSDKRDIIFSEAQKFTLGKLLDNIRIIEETRNNIRKNANYQLSMEVMLMKLQEE